MYTKDLNHKMTLRLDDDLNEFIKKMSDIYHLTPSDFIRQTLAIAKRSYDLQVDAEQKAINAIIEKNKEKEGLENGNDRKTDFNNIV